MTTSSSLLELFRSQQANRWNVAQSGAEERIAKLKKLRDAIFTYEKDLQAAIHADYQKHPTETYLTEIYPTIGEINHTIKHLKKWMKPKKVGTPVLLFGTRSEVRYEARGVVLILSPWNYPFQLLLSPLVAAIAAGNCVIAKPSSKVPNTSRFLKKFFDHHFPSNEIALVEGDPTVADQLLELPFDHIFFTGSPAIGKKIMAKASQHLASVTLELGGKSPIVIDETANATKAAERLVWAKFINAGQTCVAPDYLLIHESKEKEFVAVAKKEIERRYGATEAERLKNPNFCRLVSSGHLEGLKKILNQTVSEGAHIAIGGEIDAQSRYLSPTILTEVTDKMEIMKEEIFGPVLPVIRYRDIQEAVSIIRSKEKPLALYVFSESQQNIERLLGQTSAGGTCVNTLLLHLANTNLPFGGVGNSGLGNYHGHYGFITFSHEKSVLRQGKLDLVKWFYPPYTKRVKKMVEWATRWVA